MSAVVTDLLARLEARGYRARVVPVERVSDLADSLDAWRRKGALDEWFDRRELRRLRFDPPEELPAPRSLIVASNPQPQVRLLFGSQGGHVPVTLPPTYVWRGPDEQVRRAALEVLAPLGYTLIRAALPVKLLAVHSGLARYGRNNICYVPGFGTFHRLVAFWSDLPPADDPWQEALMLERCQDCSACRRQCPTGAIGEDRFLLHAERCLTFHNEDASAIPEWVDSSWHHAIVGCMRCQLACPENREHRDWIEDGPEFSAEETELLLRGIAADQLPAETASKLESVDLVDYQDVLARNLRLALQQGERGP
ncbi:MAG: 4Fe-4S double cluster binding domain-containing protein [Anaerolineae bacterium]|nr:4Fe-4S double cluster binding domain-containing protein [Anaerolineae bacterium]